VVGCSSHAINDLRKSLYVTIESHNARKYSRVVARSTYLERTTQLARVRMEATKEKLMNDEYARLFVEGIDIDAMSIGDIDSEEARSFDFLATKFVDETVLSIASMVNMNREQEYSQVVLIGDGSCARFSRLPWPAGTVIFVVAPAEVHERAEAILQSGNFPAMAPRGCLLRRVDLDFSDDLQIEGLLEALEAKGFQGGKLSVFGLQGLRAIQLSPTGFDTLYSAISNAAAFESVVTGEFPAHSSAEMERFVAGYGMVGNDVPLDVVRDQCMPSHMIEGADSRWMRAIPANKNNDLGWILFRATQRRLSLYEMETLALHSEAAAEADEDFFGNFS
jgi:O-methyltransferase involved in polyketide biosynthesis